MYFHGESVEPDFKKAFEYFKKGADNGNAVLQFSKSLNL